MRKRVTKERTGTGSWVRESERKRERGRGWEGGREREGAVHTPAPRRADAILGTTFYSQSAPQYFGRFDAVRTRCPTTLMSWKICLPRCCSFARKTF